MPTREISHDEWADFFDNFSRDHRGWPVTLDVHRKDIGAQTEARDLPLEGITYDVKSDSGEEVSIMIGDDAQQHIVRTIAEARRVRVKQDDNGTDEAVEIESAAGTRSVIRLGAPESGNMTNTGNGQGQASQTPEEKRESGMPGGGQGRVDEVGGSGVYPASGPLPESGKATYHGQASWGQGERGAAGYEDHGDSELTMMPDGTVIGGGTPPADQEQTPGGQSKDQGKDRPQRKQQGK